MSNCDICGGRPQAKHKLDCKCCRKVFHINCVDVDEDQLQFYIAGDAIWLCTGCNAIIGNKQTIVTDATAISDIQNSLKMILDQQNHFLLKMVRNDQDIKNLKAKAKDAAIEEDITGHDKRIKILETAMKTLEDTNNTLKTKMDNFQQSSRINCLEVTGVPKSANENNIKYH
ncbi:unnamed protein product [Phaedon cochleariae]|uniref:PHD-type domain-containing protein n=1 Tax=Phaedon cochleariae TaxID=80249 RepID=A0A9P0DL00_PHACE|nr:unnamed protein product [Phaedon cochleariae]